MATAARAVRPQTSQAIPAAAVSAAAARTPARAVAQARAVAAKPAPAVIRLREGANAMRSAVRQAGAMAKSAGPGQPLAPGVREALERSLGVDLGGVRVHTEARTAAVVDATGARAFTYGAHVFLGSRERPTDLALLAHEVAHVVQQQQGAPAPQPLAPGRAKDACEREAERAASAVARGEPFDVRERTTRPRVQRLGLSDALDYFADAANAIPGYRMFTIVVGVNPINMRRVESSAANILRAIVEFIPGGNLITRALDQYSVFERVGAWVESEISRLGISGASIRQSIDEFLDSLSWSDIFDLGGVWARARRILADPVGRLIDLGRSLIGGIMRFLKEAVLLPLARLAEGTRGYPLLKAVLGQDPITGEAVPRNAETLIGGFMQLIGQQEVWNNLQRSRAVPRAWAWFQGALEGLMGFVRQIPGMIVSLLQSVTLEDFLPLTNLFAKVGRAFGGFAGSFFSWAGNQVLSLLQIIFEVVAPNAMPYIRRAAGALSSIFRNPIGFVGNLVRAGVQGFRQFGRNFLSHLRSSLIAWLTGTMSGASIYVPQAFTLVEIIKFVLSVLGLTWQNIRVKLVRLMGEPAVRVLETTFGIVVTLVREGPAAAWERIRESISNLREMVMEQVMTFVRDRVVQAAITRLVTSLNPAGAFIQAIIATYNTIMFFVERLQQIARVVASFVDSISAIAAGNVGTAASRVETTMAGMLTLVISFLARIAGLGRVSDAVIAIVNRVRQPIDRALDRVVEWIRTMAQRAMASLRGGRAAIPGGVRAALRELKRLAERETTPAQLRAQIPGIKQRYGLSLLEIRPQRDGSYVLVGRASPEERETARADLDQLIYRALVALSRQLYAGPDRDRDAAAVVAATAPAPGRARPTREDEARAQEELFRQQTARIQSLSGNIQRSLARLQIDYGRAAAARPRIGITVENAPNTFSVLGTRLFVDQIQNRYIVPAVRVTGLRIVGERIGAANAEVAEAYSYRAAVPMSRLRDILLAIGGAGGGGGETEITMFAASMIAEPSRYSVAHITNLLAVGDPAPPSGSAFAHLSMTTGGTDPGEGRTSPADPRLAGARGPGQRDMPQDVTDRDLQIVKRRADLMDQINQVFANRSSTDAALTNEIRLILQRAIESIRPGRPPGGRR